MVQNVLLVWLDGNIDENNDDCKNIITQLRRSVNHINTFTDGDKCIEFIESINQEKVCMIISGALGQHILPRVHDMSQVGSIFIFCGNKKHHEAWTKDWSKIKGVFTEIAPICEVLKEAAQECEHNAVSISFMSTIGGATNKNLDQLDCSFMYTRILKEILLTIKFEPEHFQEFIHYSRQKCAENESELQNIKKLERKYRDQTPIWWYTYECFLYPMLNRALRTMDANIIVKMGFFISDLHLHIEKLHSDQFNGQNSGNTFTVYRGQSLSKADFDSMMKAKGGLMAFNNFLSTSKNRSVSLGFARKSLSSLDMVAILFVMTIDPAQSTTPFVSITDVSYFHEENEVLFSMQSVFRIQDIKSMGEDKRLYQVELILTNDNDKDLQLLTERIREDIPGSGWYRLGELLRKMGQFNKAEEVYQVLLKRTTDESEKAAIYHQLASANYDQGEYQEAVKLYEQVLEIYRKTLPPHHLSLAASYNNIGMVYDSMGDYSKALSYYLKGLEISEKTLPPNRPDLAMSYNNIGVVYKNMGDYSKAISYYDKALKIRQKSLPANHPDLGMSYNNIGVVYCNMSDYSKALSNYETALKIRQQSLPPNHPSLGNSYNNIGAMYFNMSDYSKALSNDEKALGIQQQSLLPNHPDLGASYNNLGLLYENMGDCLKPRSFYERAVENGQHSLPANHPTLQQRKQNIEDVGKKL
jgi:tetratricopeptide (TPR) repeat protein